MALKPNAIMVFKRYTFEDGGIRLYFVCADPGAGEPSEYDIFVTDAELNAVSTGAEFNALAITKLQRRFRASAKLDNLISRSVII